MPESKKLIWLHDTYGKKVIVNEKLDEIDPKELPRRNYQKHVVGGPACPTPGRPDHRTESEKKADKLITSINRLWKVQNALLSSCAYHDRNIDSKKEKLKRLDYPVPDDERKLIFSIYDEINQEGLMLQPLAKELLEECKKTREEIEKGKDIMEEIKCTQKSNLKPSIKNETREEAGAK